MKRLLRKIFVIVSVFLLFVQTTGMVRFVKFKAETLTTEVDIVIDDNQEGILVQFDGINRFSRYGFAEVYKTVVVSEGDYNYEERLWGLINTQGELVLDLIYDAISDYDDYFYQITINDNDQFNLGLVSKVTGKIVIEPKFSKIPNIYGQSYTVLEYQEFDPEHGTEEHFQELYRIQNQNISKVLVPAEMQERKTSMFAFHEVTEHILQVSSHTFVHGEGEGEGSSLLTTHWLTDKNLNMINLGDIDSVDLVKVFNNSLYITTYKNNEGRLYRGTVANGVYEHETILDSSTRFTFNAYRNAFGYIANDDKLYYSLESGSSQIYDDNEHYFDEYEFLFELEEGHRYTAFKTNEQSKTIIKDCNEDETECRFLREDGEELVPFGFSRYYHDLLYDDWGYIMLKHHESNRYLLADSNYELLISNEYADIHYFGNNNYLTLHGPYNLADKDEFAPEKLKDYYLTGYYHLENKTLIEPQFATVDEAIYQDNAWKTTGLILVSKPSRIIEIEEFEGEEIDGVVEYHYTPVFDKQFGLLGPNLEYLLEPVYDEISQFENQMYLKFYKDVEEGLESKRMEGFYGFHEGLILESSYDSINSTREIKGYFSMPIFDKYDHINVMKDDLIGIANRDGIIFEPEYLEAYYEDGHYFLRENQHNWLVHKKLDDTQKQINTSSIDGDGYVRFIGLLDDYIVVDQGSDNNFGIYIPSLGLFTQDMEKILSFGHIGIRFDGENWYLEKYNESTSTYQYSILDKDFNIIIPFENKYDNLGDYIGGYAIGQSGEKSENQDTQNPLAFMNIFTKVKANEEDGFVLDIINEQGEVVGDLSDKYDNVTLIGENNGDIKALVELEGKLYLGTLVENEVETQEVTGVTLNEHQLMLEMHETFQLIATIIPANATNKNVGWYSENSEVVTVSDTGLLTAVGVGNTSVTVTTEDGNKTMSVLVEVVKPEVSISLDKKILNMEIGETDSLEVTILPETITGPLTWVSDDPTVATVNEAGVITAISVGSTVVTVAIEDEEASASTIINVFDNELDIKYNPRISEVIDEYDQTTTVLTLSLDETIYDIFSAYDYVAKQNLNYQIISEPDEEFKIILWPPYPGEPSYILVFYKLGAEIIELLVDYEAATIISESVVTPESCLYQKLNAEFEYQRMYDILHRDYWYTKLQEEEILSEMFADYFELEDDYVTSKDENYINTHIRENHYLRSSDYLILEDAAGISISLSIPFDYKSKIYRVEFIDEEKVFYELALVDYRENYLDETSDMLVFNYYFDKNLKPQGQVNITSFNFEGEIKDEFVINYEAPPMNILSFNSGSVGEAIIDGVELMMKSAAGYFYQLDGEYPTEYRVIHPDGSITSTVVEDGLVNIASNGYKGQLIELQVKFPTYNEYFRSVYDFNFNLVGPVTKVELNSNNVTLNPSEDYQLEAFIRPVDAQVQELIWVVADESIATVDQYGKVKALAPGITQVRAISLDRGYEAEAIIKVNSIPVSGIALSKDSIELKVGQDETLIATVNPEDATNKAVIWSSSNENIATVDQNGKVVAKARGVVTITATTEDGAFKASATVTVTQPVLGITLDKTSVNLNIGANTQLTATINPSNANNQSVTWSSSNTNVATVNNAGKVTAIGAGQATITVTTVDGNKKATSLITVNQKDINVLEVTGTKLVNGILTNLHINNTVSNFTSQIKAKDQNASVDIFNASGRLKLAGEKIVTGDRIKVKLASSTVVEYTAAIKGDINGDGNINAADYVALANHLLRKNNLSGAALVAAYIREKDTVTVNAADYVALANHLLRKNPIHK